MVSGNTYINTFALAIKIWPEIFFSNFAIWMTEIGKLAKNWNMTAWSQNWSRIQRIYCEEIFDFLCRVPVRFLNIRLDFDGENSQFAVLLTLVDQTSFNINVYTGYIARHLFCVKETDAIDNR